MRWRARDCRGHDWFAWHPVKIGFGVCWVWLEVIERRRTAGGWYYLLKDVPIDEQLGRMI